MKLSRLFLFTLKRYFKNPIFLILLILLPLVTFFLSRQQEAEDSPIRVGYYFYDAEKFECSYDWIEIPQFDENDIEDEDVSILGLSVKDVFERALPSYEGMFSFETADTVDDLVQQVTTGKMEVAFLIPNDLYQRMLAGEKDEQILVLSSPSTTLCYVADEAMYSLLFSGISEEALAKFYVTRSSIADEVAAEEDFEDNLDTDYNNHRTDGSTFAFDYINPPEEYRETANIGLAPLRGILAILVLLSALIGAFDFYKESSNPLFAKLNVRVAYIMVPAFLCSLDALLCLRFSGYFEAAGKEVLAMFCYFLACCIFTILITMIIKRQVIYYACLPVFLLCCLIMVPVFFDFSAFVPSLKVISYLFLPTYYLKLF